MKARKPILAALAAVAALALTGCSNGAVPMSMVGVIVGDGTQDQKVHQIVYPGNGFNLDTNKRIVYLPGTARNYNIGPRENTDRSTPTVGRTKSGTEVRVALDSAWQLNQDPTVLAGKFAPFCGKYPCWQDDPAQRDQKASVQGWLDMLSEHVSPAFDEATRAVMPEFGDEVWQKQENWDKVAARLAEEFSASMRSSTSTTDDFLCGAGDTSRWVREGKTVDAPSTSDDVNGATFECGPVTIRITDISAADTSLQQAQAKANAAEQQKIANKAVLDAATEKYGDRNTAGKTLADLDLIDKCATTSGCQVVIGGTGSVSMSNPPQAQTGE